MCSQKFSSLKLFTSSFCCGSLRINLSAGRNAGRGKVAYSRISLDATTEPTLEGGGSVVVSKNHPWKLTYLPPRVKPRGYRWIFKKKFKPKRSTYKYKARLVVKGCTRKISVNYFDAFALLMTRISSITILIVLASIHDLVIH